MGDRGKLWDTANTSHQLDSGVHGGGPQEKPPDNTLNMTDILDIPENSTVTRRRQRDRTQPNIFLVKGNPTICGTREIG